MKKLGFYLAVILLLPFFLVFFVPIFLSVSYINLTGDYFLRTGGSRCPPMIYMPFHILAFLIVLVIGFILDVIFIPVALIAIIVAAIFSMVLGC